MKFTTDSLKSTAKAIREALDTEGVSVKLSASHKLCAFTLAGHEGWSSLIPQAKIADAANTPLDLSPNADRMVIWGKKHRKEIDLQLAKKVLNTALPGYDSEITLDNTSAMTVWMARINRAFEAAKGVKGEFHTSYQSHDEETKPYHDHKGQSVEVVRLILSSDDPGNYDEETLPYFIGRFDDGVELVCGFEEIFSHDERIIELMDAVNAGFNLARGMDYYSPSHLDEEGSAEEKGRFVNQVKTMKLGLHEGFNTPKEFLQPKEEKVPVVIVGAGSERHDNACQCGECNEYGASFGFAVMNAEKLKGNGGEPTGVDALYTAWAASEDVAKHKAESKARALGHPITTLEKIIDELYPQEKSDDYDLGFAIHIDNDLEENAREKGIDLDEYDSDLITQNLLRLERNMLNKIRSLGFQMRDEGHDDQDDLIGTIWVNPNDAQRMQFIQTGLEESWAAWDLHHNSPIYDGIESPVLDVADIRISFFTDDATKDEIMALEFDEDFDMSLLDKKRKEG